MSRQTAVAALVIGAIATAMVSLGILLNAKRNREQPVVTYPCPVCPPCPQASVAPPSPCPSSAPVVVQTDARAHWNAGYTQGREDWRCTSVWRVPEVCQLIAGRPGTFYCPEAQP